MHRYRIGVIIVTTGPPSKGQAGHLIRQGLKLVGLTDRTTRTITGTAMTKVGDGNICIKTLGAEIRGTTGNPILHILGEPTNVEMNVNEHRKTLGDDEKPKTHPGLIN